MTIIRVNNLKKYFGETKAVDGISFEVKKGEIMGFLGPNGAGKTTTIRCLMDFLRPDEGTIKILGRDAQTDSQKLKWDIGFLSEEVNLYESWTGQDHINLVKKIRNANINASALVTKLDFDPQKMVKNLSSGNKRKLGLILALMHQPKVLILDEPTVYLDPLLLRVIHEILKAEAQKGTTIFMSSHNLSEVEQICDRGCIIKKGKLMAVESLPQLKKKKLYTVYVHFEEAVPREEFISDGVRITDQLAQGFVLRVKGEINPLIRKFTQFKIKDLEITKASLEEVFLEFYE